MKEKAFLTGSLIYGPYREGISDIDIVVAPGVAENLAEMLEEIGIECHFILGNKYGSFYFTVPFTEQEINIIATYGPSEFFGWRYATQKMKEHGPVKDREEKIRLFKKYRDEGINRADISLLASDVVLGAKTKGEESCEDK